jgi:hypothetical protein
MARQGRQSAKDKAGESPDATAAQAAGQPAAEAPRSDTPAGPQATGAVEKTSPSHARPSSVVDTRVIYCGDNLEQLRKLPDGCVDLIYIDPPFNSNRNYEVFWGETKEKRAFEDRHASTQAYIDYMRPRCVELARVLSLSPPQHLWTQESLAYRILVFTWPEIGRMAQLSKVQITESQQESFKC